MVDVTQEHLLLSKYLIIRSLIILLHFNLVIVTEDKHIEFIIILQLTINILTWLIMEVSHLLNLKIIILNQLI